ncbi:T9SS type A sorting domain-containing protein [Christiangramia aquimixticola]|uniref:T9SS type A sorting domain-containing protein n=1 Tax=Christiangramia aquimixticola TaxID=1697558 RepID=UPI003AA8B1DD
MEKNLLSRSISFWVVIFITSWGYAQTCSPSVSIVSNAASNTICAGDSVMFTATPSADAGNNIQYTWRINGINQGPSSTSNTFQSSNLQNNNIVSAILTSNCTSGPASSNNISINVKAVPTVSSGNASISICQGGTTPPLGGAYGGSATSAIWTDGGAGGVFTNNSGNTPGITTYSPAPTATSPVTLTLTTSGGDCGNVAAFKTLTINPNPSVNAGGSLASICLGGTTTVLGGSFSGATAAIWSDGGAGGSFSNNSGSNPEATTYTASVTAPASIILTLTTSGGSCGNVSASKNLTINPNPTVNAGGAIPAICQGGTTAALGGSFGGGATSAIWSANITGGSFINNSGSTPGTTTYTAPPNAPTSIILTLTTAGGSCNNVSATKTLNINPNSSVSVGGAIPAICQGGTTAALNGSFGGGATSAIWSASITGGSFINNSGNTPNTATYTAPANAPASIILTLTSSGGTCNSVSATKTLTVNPNPTVNAGSALPTICQGGTTGGLGGSYGGGATSAIWTDGNAGGSFTNNSGSTPGTATYTPPANSPSSIVLTLTTSGGSCGNISASKPLTVTTSLTPSVTITSSSTSICSASGTAVTFTANPINGGVSPTYQWKRNGINISGATNFTYTPTALASPSTITVTMTSSAICASPAAVTSNGIAMTVYNGDPTNWTGGNPIISPASVCPTGTISISTEPVTNAEYYIWTLPQGFNITGGAGTNNITVFVGPNAVIGNNQNITVQAFNPCGSNNSKTDKINVNGFNGVTVPSSAMGVCSGGFIDVVGTLTGNAASGTWTATSGSFSNIVTSGTNPRTVSARYTPSLTEGNAVLTITTNTPTGGGCPNVPGKATIDVSINKPSVSPTSIGTSATICRGGNATLTQTGGSLGTGASWKWYSNPGFTTLVGTSNAANASLLVSPTTTTTYYLRAESTTGTPCIANIAAPGGVTVTVNQPVIISSQPNPSQTICTGSQANFSVTATGTGLTYQWKKDGANITGANSATYTIPNVSTANAGTYSVEVNATAPCTTVTSTNAILNVNEAVVITSQPATSQTLCSGNTANFNVTATGTGLNYQWKKDGTNIMGATASSYTIPNITSAHSGTYTVLVTGTSACSPATSTNAILNVNQEVAISSQPVPAQTLCSGDTANFSITATGSGLTYQWKKDGNNISGANLPTYSISGVSAVHAGTYTVEVRGTSPCTPVISANSVLNINEKIQITSQPVNSQILCSRNTANFSVTASGTGLTYQWRKDGVNIAGATAANYSLPNLKASDSGIYTVVINGTAPCNTVISYNSVLNINQEVIITSQPQASQNICSGFPMTLSVSATGSGLNYEWFKNDVSIGITTSSLSINRATAADAGTYKVRVKGTAPCNEVTSQNAVITVTENIIINSQPVGADLCEGEIATFQVLASGNVIGYEWRKGGLPITDNGNYSGTRTNKLTIANLLPANAGSYDVVITSSDNSCAQIISNPAILKVKASDAMSLTSGAGTDSQTKCINTAITPIIYIISNAPAASITAGGLPAGITGSFNSGKFTISGTPAEAGNFSYTVTTTGECNNVSLTGTIKVDPNHNISLSSGAATTNQILCIGTPLTNITYNTTGATGATFSGLPAGVTGNWNNNVIIISGTPTASGVFSYTITTTGSCNVATATGTINVNPNNSISLTSAAGTSNQTVCENVPITGIRYSTTGATGATFSGLPAGVNGNWVNNVVTISGTPTAASNPTTYTVTLIGGCSVVSTTGTINVNPNNTISLSSGPGTNNQTLCVNTPLTSIKYNTTGATGATFSGLPAGINGSWTANVVTISGTPTSAGGPFNYMVTLTGGCSSVTATGTINVNPNNSLNLISAAGTNNQTICVNSPLTQIRYSTTGATNAVVTGLPAGITGAWAGNVVTISGTPTNASGPLTYTVTLTGGCNAGTTTGTINVSANNTLSLSSATGTDNQTVCVNSPITQIRYNTTGATGVTFSGLPMGVTGSWAGNIVTISGTPTVVGGPFNYTVTTAGGCSTVALSGTIKTDPRPIGGNLLFAQNNDRIFLSCGNPTSSASLTNLNLLGHSGTIVSWKYRKSSATTWTPLAINGTTLSASQIYSLGVSETLIFQVEISNGTCSPNAFSQTAVLSVIPAGIGPSPINVDPAVVCKGEKVTLSSSTGYGDKPEKFEGGAFDNSSITNKGWRITDKNGVSGYNFESSADNRRPDKWLRASPRNFATANINTNVVTDQRWDTKLGNSGNQSFAIVSGNNPSTLETPIFALSGLDQAVMTFDQAFNLTGGASIIIEISTNSGVSYSSEPLLYSKTGPLSSGNYDRFSEGTLTINKMTIDLGNYVGRDNLRIRFRFEGIRDGDIWALDNVVIPQGPRNISLEWIDYSDPSKPGGTFIGNNESELWEPKLIGWNLFQVKTAINLDSNGQNCSSIENSKTIRVFVFDRYTTSVTAGTGACGNKEINLIANTNGAFGGNVTTYPTKDGYIGEWVISKAGVIADPSTYTLTNTDSNSALPPKNNPNAKFEAGSSGDFTFAWKLTPTFIFPADYYDVTQRGKLVQNTRCLPVIIPSTVSLPDCTMLDFDGVDDYVSIANTFADVKTVEFWIYPEAATGTIISGPGVEIKMADLSTYLIPNTRWYHVALIDKVLYVDGVDTKSTISSTGTGNITLIGAKWNSITKKPESYFSGWIEEVRIWKSALQLSELRFMMNQRLDLTSKLSGDIQGEVVPNKIVAGSYHTLGEFNLDSDGQAFYNKKWNELIGYYRLISASPDPVLNKILDTHKPVNGFTIDLSLSSVNGRLHNMNSNQQNTSPTPYFSVANGSWVSKTTWARPLIWDYPNSSINSNPIEWNIARINHDIYSGNKNIVMLGLLSEGKELSINPSNPLRITHYLLLNGNIDLEGESQLLQDHGSILANQSDGWIEIDQKGKKSSYNYNYWTSPVSNQGSNNNSGFQLINVLFDGSDPDNPTKIIWKRGYYDADGPKTIPRLTLTDAWIWDFRSGAANNYGGWQFMGNSFLQITGAGYSMKGTTGLAALDEEQNYVFRGKPNNGDIPTTELKLLPSQNYLVGNPYPSAIDAKEFLLDNLAKAGNGPGNNKNGQNVFNGTLYYWDHFGGKSHNLAEYVGGYATYTLSGPLPAISNDLRINNTGNEGIKRPWRYIPVAQGFFLNSSPVGNQTFGGEIIFDNTQRIYKTISADSSIFLQQEKPLLKKEKTGEDTRAKIRLKFESPGGYHRQILVTKDPNTTNGFDLGYDAPLIENNKEDMYWWFENSRFVIQGVPNFDDDQVLPLAIKTFKEGSFTILIDSTENWPAGKSIFLRDVKNDSIHDLLSEKYVSTENIGEVKDRFEIVFYKEQIQEPLPPEEVIDPTLPVIDGNIGVSYSTFTKQVKISNYDLLEVNKVMVFDMGGKLIQEIDDLKAQKEIYLSLRPVRSGVYIVKVISIKGVINKKVVIK